MDSISVMILEKLDGLANKMEELQREVQVVKRDLQGVKQEVQVMRMEMDDNFARLYVLMEKREIEAELLNKRLFKLEAEVEHLRK